MVNYFNKDVQGVHIPELEEDMKKIAEESKNKDPIEEIKEVRENDDSRKYDDLDDLFADLGSKYEWLDKILDIIYWPISRFCTKWFRDKPKEFKWFIQRGKRGYSDCDVWGFHHHMSTVILGGLKELRENLHGFPPEITFEEWKRILDEMIYTFQTLKDVDDEKTAMFDSQEYDEQRKWYDDMIKDTDVFSTWTDYDDPKFPKYPKHVMSLEDCQRYDKGWKYFKEYYFQLWD